MAVHNFTGGAAEHRDRKSEFADRGAHAINCGIVLPRVALVLLEPGDWFVNYLQAGHPGQ
jgi:hypothetical protein